MTSPINPSARDILVNTLREWGLAELTGDLDRLIKDGLDAPAVQLRLSETDAYKRRFAGNDERKKKGLPVLSPAEYIAAETSYKTVLRSYGLPASFYDSQDDFHQFIGNDVSPDELNDRAGIAQQVWLSNDAPTRDAWRSFYGLSDGAAIASILDPDRALPVVQRMANAARFGGLATSQGLEADRGRLEQYADTGVSADTVAGAFSKIAQTQGADDRIAQRFGTTLSQAEKEAELIKGDATAANKRERLYRDETALFQGRGGADTGALQRTRSGRF